jgi:hypothetical protein
MKGRMDDLNISQQEEAMKGDIKMVWSQNKKEIAGACSPPSHQRRLPLQQGMNHEDIFRLIYQSHKKQPLLPQHKMSRHPYRLRKPQHNIVDSGKLPPTTVNALPNVQPSPYLIQNAKLLQIPYSNTKHSCKRQILPVCA